MFLYQSGEALIPHQIYLPFLVLSSCKGYSYSVIIEEGISLYLKE